MTAPKSSLLSELYIGLMSGTSMDGVDGVLVRFEEPTQTRPEAIGRLTPVVLAHCHRPFPRPFVDELLSLNTAGPNELHRAQLAATALTRIYADGVWALLEQGQVAASEVRAIASHGQTVRHQPGAFDGLGYTLQLNQPALLAELCGVDVVADFRSRDLAAGGQGAPLVPAFHQAAFSRPGEHVAVLNIGGISNLTLLPGEGGCTGFDCGPGNVLMDLWCQQHTGQAYDDQGQWAATGQVIEPLLRTLLAEPYLLQPAPKSTGRDLFNTSWLQAALAGSSLPEHVAVQDVQATLLEFTVRCCTDAIQRHMPQTKHLFVCGGGAFNQKLMSQLAGALPGVRVTTTDLMGLAADQVEATAFAWLGWAFCHRVPGNLPAVTGAAGPRILGALYPCGSDGPGR
jgi:anhydro-N-acetylmuramic acid kinase